MMCERRDVKGILLGDRGYPQLPYLYTPLANPVTAPERRYNAAHIVTRCMVERCFGIWKRRFACLSMKLRTKLETSSKIILACAVLHNVARQRREDIPDMVPDLLDRNVPVAAVHQRNQRGAAERVRFIQQHFGQE
ncbi:putative nuclease HARBI1 [Ischnura elegans]|uniref:putative nuclease HARBI1 n=1 Tax=Ischnura elegans TaxID=197161 RepID=UPI001ED89894|nr:putative nuclease HARBI1 [Ischnura elegans]